MKLEKGAGTAVTQESSERVHTDIEDPSWARLLETTLDILMHCERYAAPGVLTFSSPRGRLGEIVLMSRRICFVAVDPILRVAPIEKNPSWNEVLSRVVARCRQLDQPLSKVLADSPNWLVARFREALFDQCVVGLVQLASAAGAGFEWSPAADSGLARIHPKWWTEWSDAKPPYPSDMTFSPFEVYRAVARRTALLDDNMPANLSGLYEQFNEDCGFALIFYTQQSTQDAPVPVDGSAQDHLSLTDLGRLGRELRLLAPPQIAEREVRGLRYTAFGSRWTGCVLLFEGDYLVALGSREPAVRARLAHRIRSLLEETGP